MQHIPYITHLDIYSLELPATRQVVGEANDTQSIHLGGSLRIHLNRAICICSSVGSWILGRLCHRDVRGKDKVFRGWSSQVVHMAHDVWSFRNGIIE